MQKIKNYEIHREKDRGHANNGWLKSKFSFSFANWYEPKRLGFGTLRVINDDIVAPAHGFGFHPHSNMEIISIPTFGELKHKDNMGNETVIKVGDVQRMSAGTGVLHSEYNNSEKDEVKFFQIWIMPKVEGINPSYEQKTYNFKDRKNKFQLVISPDGRESSVSINQDAYFSLLELDKNKNIQYKKFKTENGIYLYLIDGKIEIFNETLNSKDAIAILEETEIIFNSKIDSKILLMEVPMK